MRVSLLLFVFVFLYSCKPTSYFVVRHAEKETSTTMAGDVTLSAQGKERAEALKILLLPEHIRSIYSTNFVRTRSTAQPLAQGLNIEIQSYEPADTGFISSLRNKKENIIL